LIRTLSYRLLRLLAVLVTALTVAISLLAWRIASGPLALDWLTPYIARALSGEGPVRVAVGGTELRLSDDVGLVELVVLDVRATEDGELLAVLPEVEVGLSLRALLHGMIAVARLDATAPHLVLLRRADGSIGLRGTESDRATGKIDLRRLPRQLLSGDPNDRASYFDRLEIRGGRLTLADQQSDHRLEARNAELVLIRQEGGLGANLDFALVQQSAGPAGVHLTGRYDAASELLRFGLDVDGLMPADLASLAPALPLGGIRLPLGGRLQGGVKLDGEWAPLGFELAGGPGRLELPDLLMAPLEIDAARAEGSLASDFEHLTMKHFEVTARDASLSGTGEGSWQGGELVGRAEVEARNVAAQDLALFWPPGAGSEARDWVISNITAGVVPQASATITIRPGDLAQEPVPESVVAGDFAFEGLTVAYFEDLPPLTGVDGNASFTARRMDFKIDTGRVGEIVADQGSVVITGIGVPGREATQLEVRARATGAVRDILSLIDRPPLGLAGEAGVSPADGAGTAATELMIGLPLHRGEIADDEIHFAASSVLTNAAIRTSSFDLKEGNLKLAVDTTGFDLTGDARVEGIPLTIAVRENFAADAPFERRYQVQGTVDAGTIARLAGDLPLELGGALGLDATILETAGVRQAEVALDLEPLAITSPLLDWQKAAGQPGSLSASLTLAEGAPIEVQGLALSAPELDAAGSMRLQASPITLESLSLDHLRFGATEGALTVRRGIEAGYDVSLNATRLDLDPLLDAARRQEEGPPEPLRLTVRAERAVLGGQELRALETDLVRDQEGWRSVLIRAKLPKGGDVSVTVAPDGDHRRLHVTSNDAGDLFATTDQTSKIKGGTLDLDASIRQQYPALDLEGRVRMTGFTVVQAPLLARLLTVASLTGIGNLLSGQGIYFDRLEMPFSYRNEVLAVDRVRLGGSQLGLTAKGNLDLGRERIDLSGTIVPVYGLNWAIGKIPIIGDFLRGSEGVGAFAMTYTVSGDTAEPSIRVNPLSVLAPGTIRELFSGILEGTTEPPKVRGGSD
jgi:uncharacterized protein YhdP